MILRQQLLRGSSTADLFSTARSKFPQQHTVYGSSTAVLSQKPSQAPATAANLRGSFVASYFRQLNEISCYNSMHSVKGSSTAVLSQQPSQDTATTANPGTSTAGLF
jgi:hypothetical protein